MILGLLGVLFVALKLLGYITWSWFWVTLPFTFGLIIAAFFFTVWLFATLAGGRAR